MCGSIVQKSHYQTTFSTRNPQKNPPPKKTHKKNKQVLDRKTPGSNHFTLEGPLRPCETRKRLVWQRVLGEHSGHSTESDREFHGCYDRYGSTQPQPLAREHLVVAPRGCTHFTQCILTPGVTTNPVTFKTPPVFG